VGAGGTVQVGPGRYHENLSLRDGQQVGIVGAGPRATVLDGRQAGSVIRQRGGDLALTALRVTNGVASGPEPADRSGGGISTGGSLTLTRVWVSLNAAADRGGGIRVLGPLTVTQSVVSRNAAGRGGGIDVAGVSATIRRSTISENRATQNGGGILGTHAWLTVENSTVSGNTAAHGSAADLFEGDVSLRHVTVAANHGSAAALTGSHLGVSQVRGSLFSGNAGADCDLRPSPDRPAVFDEANVSNDGTCGWSLPDDQMDLLPLADNSALTRSHALGENSALRGWIPLAHPLCDGTDQSGALRRGTGAAFCDVGAEQSAPGVPHNVVPPVIGEISDLGHTLTADPGGWYAAGELRYAYQWERCALTTADCTPIPGADTAQHTGVAADYGHRIRVKVTATNSHGTSAPAYSDITAETGAG
jgi:hypothetical protein